MKNNQYYGSSKRRTPWDRKKELSPVQSFIKSNYLDTYYDRHPKLKSTNEANLINSFSPECCIHCGSINFKKNGLTFNGIQRYKCTDCRRSFTILTGTLFEDHKISITEWIEYLLNLFGYVSFHSTSRNSRIADSTVKYWLLKLFEILKHYQDDIVLTGDVYIDETFYKVAKKDIRKNKKGYVNMETNQYCIGIGYDFKKVYCHSQGLAKHTSYSRTYDSFINHIAKGSHLIHDMEASHNILIEPLELISTAYNGTECKKLPDKDNPLQPINDQCALLKQFLNSHRGFDREYLQDYLNLYTFITNPPYEKLEKIEANSLLCFIISINLDIGHIPPLCPLLRMSLQACFITCLHRLIQNAFLLHNTTSSTVPHRHGQSRNCPAQGRAAASSMRDIFTQGRAMPYSSGLIGATPASYCIQQTTDCQ